MPSNTTTFDDFQIELVRGVRVPLRSLEIGISLSGAAATSRFEFYRVLTVCVRCQRADARGPAGEPGEPGQQGFGGRARSPSQRLQGEATAVPRD